MPHLRRGLIATKVGSSCGARSVVQGEENVGIFAAAKIAHLSRFASKMGHPARASEAEAAIYWSSALMGEKLTTAFLLLHPEKISGGEKTIFKLHGLILKYVRIYNAAYNAKQVRLDVTGYSIGEVKADSAILSVIPHTLLDNALKYSRAGSRVVAHFEETWSTITFSVASYGPRIDDDEKEKIFDIFYRGRHAEAQEDGSGFGLHLAQFIARELGTSIKMNQAPQASHFGYETTFYVSFERER